MVEAGPADALGCLEQAPLDLIGAEVRFLRIDETAAGATLGAARLVLETDTYSWPAQKRIHVIGLQATRQSPEGCGPQSPPPGAEMNGPSP